MHATLVPAFGRDYKSKEKAKADWENGLDWYMMGPPMVQGGYVSVRDKEHLLKQGITSVRLRFDDRRKLVDVPLEKSNG